MAKLHCSSDAASLMHLCVTLNPNPARLVHSCVTLNSQPCIFVSCWNHGGVIAMALRGAGHVPSLTCEVLVA